MTLLMMVSRLTHDDGGLLSNGLVCCGRIVGVGFGVGCDVGGVVGDS